MFFERQSLEMKVGYDEAILSLAQYTPVEAKCVVKGNHTKSFRLTISEHVKLLLDSGKINPKKPTIVLSVRNVLSNLRCGAWVKGLTTRFLSVVGEEAKLSQRPFHVLGMRDGKLEITELFLTKKNLQRYEWLISGVPVLWDDNSDLFERMVTEAADHSHIWHIPRGSHPQSTPETVACWKQLHEQFQKVLYLSRKDAFDLIIQHTKGLKREDMYLHNVLGVDEEGRLVQKIAIGRLECLGSGLRQMGAHRAIMVDNGGSPTVYFCPKGVTNEGVRIFAAAGHRLPGTSYLFFQVPNSKFSLY